MNEGYIKLHRKVLDDALWKICTPEQKVIMITILLKANHKKNEWGWNGFKFIVKPGEFITSLDKLKNACGKKISLQNVRSALVKFKKYHFLTEEVTKESRKISLCNWGKYQTTNIATNKQLTKHQQSTNKALTPNKNDKNEKNDNKESIEYKLSEHLLDMILNNNPEYKKPDLSSWSKHIDLMIRIDKRKPNDIEDVIDWCQADDFWYKNILSTKKLREKYDRLYMSMNSKSSNKKESSDELKPRTV